MVPILKTEHLTKYFSALCAVNDLDLEINSGTIVGLIGPNGAGKTTIFNLITGFIKPSRGKISFNNQDVTGFKPYKICGLGLSRTFQLVNNFPEFTVLQNVLIGGHRHSRVTPKMFFGWPGKEEVDQALKMLKVVGLDHLASERAANLASGQQKSLQFAIAMMCRPELLLLDEPLSGMTHKDIELVLQIIRQIREQGVTILLIEHNMKAVMEICERLIVIDFGMKVAEGPPESIKQNPKVIEIYLGAGK